jgi:hypothetical protein
MSILIEVAKELLSMFLADARLTITTLILVALIAVLVVVMRIEPMFGGGLLLAGCLAILVEAVAREARRRRLS